MSGDDKSLAIARATTLAGRLIDLEAEIASTRELCDRVLDAIDAPRLGADQTLNPDELLPGTIVLIGGDDPGVAVLTHDKDLVPWLVTRADGSCDWAGWDEVMSSGHVTVIGAIPGTPASGVKP